MALKPFVNILPVYYTHSERTVEKLNSIYYSKSQLISLIKKVSSNWLNERLVKGKRILIKPNWVKHDSKSSDILCLRTHDEFVLAGLEVILEMQPAFITIADAPIQGADWTKMLSKGFIEKVNNLSANYNIPVIIKDLRRVTFNPLNNKLTQEINPIEEYRIFDLANESYLEPISKSEKTQFRVTYYNPDKLKETHQSGMHKYCISNELFYSDVVISMPKIKTHQKTGLTGAIKNLIGLNGDKDYLPHHRLGGTGFGGDCYPGKNYLRYLAEITRDTANRKKGTRLYWPWFKLSSLVWKASLPGKEHQIGAGWFGNDTTWRMVLDINKIALFGSLSGELHTTQQRSIFSLCDGIIGGQGNGPLNPDPLALGHISFTNHSGMNDICMARLMDFDPERISLLNQVSSQLSPGDIDIFYNGKAIIQNDLKEYAIKTIPPPGWLKHLSQ